MSRSFIALMLLVALAVCLLLVQRNAPPASAEARTDAQGDPLPPYALLRVGTVRFRHGRDVAALAVAPDGKTVASASWDETFRIWDFATGKELRRWAYPPGRNGGSYMVDGLAFSHDGKRLASGGHDFDPFDGGEFVRKIVVWDPATGEPVSRFFTSWPFHDSLAFLGDQDTVVHHERLAIHFTDAATGKERRAFPVGVDEENRPGRFQRDFFNCFAVGTDGALLLTGEYKGQVRLWDVERGKEVRKLGGDAGVVSALALSPDQHSYAWGNAAGELGRGSVSGHELQLLTLDGAGAIRSLTFSPDGKQLAAADSRGVVAVFAAKTGKLLHRIEAHGGHHSGLAYTPDGKYLVSAGSDSCIRVWDAATGKERRPTPALRGEVKIALAPDGSRLATSGAAQPIRCWNADTGREVQSWPCGADRLEDVRFSADIPHSANNPDKQTGLQKAWGTWRTHRRRMPSVRFADGFQADALAPDEKSVAGGGPDKKLSLYTRADVRTAVARDLGGLLLRVLGGRPAVGDAAPLERNLPLRRGDRQGNQPLPLHADRPFA